MDVRDGEWLGESKIGIVFFVDAFFVGYVDFWYFQIFLQLVSFSKETNFGLLFFCSYQSSSEGFLKLKDIFVDVFSVRGGCHFDFLSGRFERVSAKTPLKHVLT